jgi:hypothetical protein
MEFHKIVENIIVIYLVGSKFYSRQFTIVTFLASTYQLRPFISMDLLLSFINRCTAHNSSVSFWTQNRLDLIKVITRAHPCHHFHKIDTWSQFYASDLTVTHGGKAESKNISTEMKILIVDGDLDPILRLRVTTPAL